MPTPISKLPTTQAVGDATTGTLIVRQTGGTVGTDEVQISHNGTRGLVKSMDGDLIFDSNGAATSTFIVRDGAGIFAVPNITDSNGTRYQLTVNGVEIGQSGIFGWTGTAGNVTAAFDTGLARASAGLVNITDGGSTTYVQVGINTGTDGRVSAPANLFINGQAGYIVFQNVGTAKGCFNNDQLRLPSTSALSWSSTADPVSVSPDTCLGRAGVNQIVQATTNTTAVAGGATSTTRTVIKKTGIADNTATAVITVTVPNANHAAGIKLKFLASTGSTDAFESSRVAEGFVVVARTTGANAVAAVAALEMAQIATVAAGATLTLAYSLSAISGAVGATNTFDIRVTIDDSGNLGSNQVVVVAELINSEASGVTMVAS